MRVLGVYCLKIICVLAMFSLALPRVDSGSLNTASNLLYKQFLKMRTLPFEDCGSRYDILYLSISCCATIPCQMRRGTTAMVNVIFDDDGANTSFLKHRVRWIFNAVRTNATITPDPCDGDHECIINSSDGKSYWATVLVTNSLPVIRGTMLWEAVDEYNKDVICFKVPVIIQV